MISTRRGESNCHLRCGPFDCAQGAWGESNCHPRCRQSHNFRHKNCWAILGGFFRDADPSTALRDPGLFWGSVGAQAVADAFLSFLDGLRRYFSWSGLFLCLLTGGLGCLAFLWQRLEFRL